MEDGNMPVQVVADVMLLYEVRKEDSSDFGDLMSGAFAPFRGDLWGMIVGTLIVVASVVGILEYKQAEDFPGQPHNTAIVSVYYTGLSFFTGGPAREPCNGISRMLHVVFAFFITISLASFTANTAAVLTMQAKKDKVKDVKDAISRGMKICTPFAVR